MNFDSLLGYAPLGVICIVLLVGIILAIVRWQQHPNVSLMTLLGCIILLLGITGGTILDRWIWSQREVEGWGHEEVVFMSRTVAWARVLVASAGYAMLFWAIFGWRQRQRSERPYDDRRYDDRRYDDRPPERKFGPPGEGERGRPEDVRRPDY